VSLLSPVKHDCTTHVRSFFAPPVSTTGLVPPDGSAPQSSPQARIPSCPLSFPRDSTPILSPLFLLFDPLPFFFPTTLVSCPLTPACLTIGAPNPLVPDQRTRKQSSKRSYISFPGGKNGSFPRPPGSFSAFFFSLPLMSPSLVDPFYSFKARHETRSSLFLLSFPCPFPYVPAVRCFVSCNLVIASPTILPFLRKLPLVAAVVGFTLFFFRAGLLFCLFPRFFPPFPPPSPQFSLLPSFLPYVVVVSLFSPRPDLFS